MPKKEKAVCGWRETASLPDLKIRKIKVKIDTGARTSSLHASDFEIFKSGSKKKVRFKIYVDEDRPSRYRWAEEELVKVTRVKSSNGKVSIRPVIQTPLKLGTESWEIELNLVDRGDMGFSMLIGRQALKKQLLVDSGRSFLLSKKG